MCLFYQAFVNQQNCFLIKNAEKIAIATYKRIPVAPRVSIKVEISIPEEIRTATIDTIVKIERMKIKIIAIAKIIENNLKNTLKKFLRIIIRISAKTKLTIKIPKKPTTK